MPFQLIETSEKTMDLPERIERYLIRNMELQNRHNGILQACEQHLHSIAVGIFALANLTTPTIPADVVHAERHVATVRARRRTT